MTNATRAAIVAAANAVLSTLVILDLFALTNEQAGSIGVSLNALLGVWVAFTYKDSPKRIPDE